MPTQNLSLYQLMDKHKLNTKDIEFAIENIKDIKEIVKDFTKAEEVLQLMNELELSPDDVKILVESYQNISLVLSSMDIIKARAIKLSEQDFNNGPLKWWNNIIDERLKRVPALV